MTPQSTWRFAFIAMLAAGSADAQSVFKVIERDGKVTYTNQKPTATAGKVSLVDIERGVVIPAPPKVSAAELDLRRDQRLNEQLVKEQIETERAKQQSFNAEATRQRAQADRLAAAKAACERSGWSDCNDPDAVSSRGWILGPALRSERNRPLMPSTPQPQPEPQVVPRRFVPVN